MSMVFFLKVHEAQITREHTMRDFKKIRAWEMADDLVVNIYSATKGFPKEELYALTSQLRRAAYSVPANIVEGSSRESKKDYLHFLHIARGSLSETHYFIHLANRLGFLLQAESDPLISATIETQRVLSGLIKSVAAET